MPFRPVTPMMGIYYYQRPFGGSTTSQILVFETSYERACVLLLSRLTGSSLPSHLHHQRQRLLQYTFLFVEWMALDYIVKHVADVFCVYLHLEDGDRKSIYLFLKRNARVSRPTGGLPLVFCGTLLKCYLVILVIGIFRLACTCRRMCPTR